LAPLSFRAKKNISLDDTRGSYNEVRELFNQTFHNRLIFRLILLPWIERLNPLNSLVQWKIVRFQNGQD